MVATVHFLRFPLSIRLVLVVEGDVWLFEDDERIWSTKSYVLQDLTINLYLLRTDLVQLQRLY
jgi:hypothetical protein